ncbi:sigma-70 family RNA polymerase sigma factor [Fulvivirgaceae bacterium BMA12]|uniref:Sigma-70 family RNA polymerase sigma factor n=1 Tax=Agaribacillus aureus TaxID=3051825 RepID=A0ABT8L0M9_9BACT|nr:sigma-70 family RNA polymerase sigma factor [Fulvivirgaceae bacterium BMA12]
MKSTDQTIVEDIRQGGNEGLIEIYKLYRSEFFSWSQRQFSLDDAASADLFQDTIISLRKNIVKGKLTHLSSSLKTYLFAIGKHLALSRLRRDSKTVLSDDLLKLQLSEDFITDAPLKNREKKKYISQILQELGEPCYSILRLYYYENFSMESIARYLDYKNENVVKSQKLRCIKTLKERVSDHKVNFED